VPQEILDGGEIGICIKHLSSHRVAKMMTGDFQIQPTGIVFQPFLDTANGYWLSGERPFLYQEDLLHVTRGSHSEIAQERVKSIITDIYDPVLCAFTILDEQCTAFKINVTESKMSHLLYPLTCPRKVVQFLC
jgi:hypothetical protein